MSAGKISSALIHMTYIPYLSSADELKTKPTQHSVRELRTIGIQPDILLCRTDRFLDSAIKQKIALLGENINIDRFARFEI